MTFRIYIYGNDLGTVDATLTGDSLHVFWPVKVKEYLRNIGAVNSCADAMLELSKNTRFTYATFAEGAGEVKTI